MSGVLIPAVATAIFAHIRRPKSTARDTGPYFTEAELLTPPMARPAYSDRMAYVLAEMSDLAYYQFEGQGGFIEDAVQAASAVHHGSFATRPIELNINRSAKEPRTCVRRSRHTPKPPGALS